MHPPSHRLIPTSHINTCPPSHRQTCVLPHLDMCPSFTQTQCLPFHRHASSPHTRVSSHKLALSSQRHMFSHPRHVPSNHTDTQSPFTQTRVLSNIDSRSPLRETCVLPSQTHILPSHRLMSFPHTYSCPPLTQTHALSSDLTIHVLPPHTHRSLCLVPWALEGHRAAPPRRPHPLQCGCPSWPRVAFTVNKDVLGGCGRIEFIVYVNLAECGAAR